MNINLDQNNSFDLINQSFLYLYKKDPKISSNVVESLRNQIKQVVSDVFKKENNETNRVILRLSKICKKYSRDNRPHEQELAAFKLLNCKFDINQAVWKLRRPMVGDTDKLHITTYELFEKMKEFFTERFSPDFEETWDQQKDQIEIEKNNGRTVLDILEELYQQSQDQRVVANCKVVLRMLELFRYEPKNIYAARDQLRKQLEQVKEVMTRYMTQPEAGTLQLAVEDLWGGRGSSNKTGAMKFWNDNFGQDLTVPYEDFLGRLYTFLNITNSALNDPSNEFKFQSTRKLLESFVINSNKEVEVGLWAKFCTLVGQPEEKNQHFLDRCQSFLLDIHPYFHLAEPDPDYLVKNKEPGTYLVRWSRTNCTFVIALVTQNRKTMLIKLDRLDNDGQFQYEGYAGLKIQGTLNEIINNLKSSGALKKAIPGPFDEWVKSEKNEKNFEVISLSEQLSRHRHRISQRRSQQEGGDLQIFKNYFTKPWPFDVLTKSITPPTSKLVFSREEKNELEKTELLPKQQEIIEAKVSLESEQAWVKLFGPTPTIEIDKAIRAIYEHCNQSTNYPQKHAKHKIKIYQKEVSEDMRKTPQYDCSKKSNIRFDCLFEIMKIVALKGNLLDLPGWRNLYDNFGPSKSLLDNCQTFWEKNHQWFHGKPFDPEDIVKSKPVGSFLLRFSETAFTFSLTYKHAEGKRPSHIRLKNHAFEGMPGKFSYNNGEQKLPLESILDVMRNDLITKGYNAQGFESIYTGWYKRLIG